MIRASLRAGAGSLARTLSEARTFLLSIVPSARPTCPACGDPGQGLCLACRADLEAWLDSRP